MENKINNKDKIGTLGRIVIFVSSLLLAGFITKKLINKYPQGVIKHFGPGLLAIFAAIFIIIALYLIGILAYDFITGSNICDCYPGSH